MDDKGDSVYGIIFIGNIMAHELNIKNGLLVSGNSTTTGNEVVSGSLTVLGDSHLGNVNLNVIQLDTTSSTQYPYNTGQLSWDSGSGTISVGMLGGVTLQLGQEEYVYAKNNSGEDIYNGEIVKIIGSYGPNVSIQKAISVTQSLSHTPTGDPEIVGIATQDISLGDFGYVTTFGIVHDVPLSGISSGELIYVSNTSAGDAINYRPPAPYDIIRVGIVLNSDGHNGSVYLLPREPSYFDNISGLENSGPIIPGQSWTIDSTGTKYIRSNKFSGSFLGTSVGSITSITTSGSIMPVSNNDYQYNNVAGVVQSPKITDLGSGTMSLDNSGIVRLYENSNNQGVITRLYIPEIQLNIPSNVTSHVNVRNISGSAQYYITTNTEDHNGSNNVIFLTTFWDGEDDEYIKYINRGEMGRGMPNKLTNRLIDSQDKMRTSGMNLSVSGSSQVVLIDAGAAWVGVNKIGTPSFKSDDGTSSLYLLYHSASQWVDLHPATTTASNYYYDDGVNLHPLSYGHYNTIWVYKYITTTESASAYYVLGNQCSSSADVDNSFPPSVPDYVTDLTVLVGRISYQSGSTTPYSVVSAFTTPFSISPVTKHGDLSGLNIDDHKQYLLLSGRGFQSVVDSIEFKGALIVSKSITIGTGSILPNSLMHIGSGDLNNYFQIDMQNYNSGSSASADFIIENDLGTDSTYYLDIGINSSTYNDSDFPYAFPNNSYIIAQTSSLVIGLINPGDNDCITLMTDGNDAFGDTVNIWSGGQVTINRTGRQLPNATLDVNGSVLISGSMIVTQDIAGVITYAYTSSKSSYTDTASYIATASNAVSSSWANSSKWSGLTGIPTGIISSSAQLPSGIVSGSLQTISNILNQQISPSGITSSLTGTASWSIISTTASYVATASWANNSITASFIVLAQTSSYVATAQTASYVTTSQTASYFGGNSISSTSSSWASSSLTSSFIATASWAKNSITSSYVQTSDTASYVKTSQTASYVSTASWSNNSVTTSYVQTSDTASYVSTAKTASFVLTSQTASFVNTAQTASYISQGAATQSLQGVGVYSSSAQLPSGTISSSAQALSGTGVYSSSAQLPSGLMSGSLQTISNILNQQISPTGITASLVGTASWALQSITSSYIATAQTASYFGGNAVSATSASWASASITASYISTASWSLNSVTSSYIVIAQTASYISLTTHNLAISGQNIVSSSTQIISGISSQQISPTGITSSLVGTASWALNSVTSSYIVTAQTASYFGGNAISATSASWSSASLTSSFAATSSWSKNSVTASYVQTSDTASFVAISQTASFVTLSQTASYVITAQTASFVTQSNNVFCFDTSSQSVTTANTFQEILFRFDGNIIGWIHPSNTGRFTSSYSGVYNVKLVTQMQRSTGTSQVVASRLLYNGQEVSGSYSSFTILTNAITQELVSESTFYVSSGSGIIAQFAGATSSISITPPALIGTSIARPSAKIFIKAV